MLSLLRRNLVVHNHHKHQAPLDNLDNLDNHNHHNLDNNNHPVKDHLPTGHTAPMAPRPTVSGDSPVHRSRARRVGLDRFARRSPGCR